MAIIDLNDFSQEMECSYDGERYSVRDNGAVFKQPRQGKRTRPTDSQWTFGKPNDKTGYMEIASVRIHRIVATAFHGEPPTPEHVVDHIDTNRRNNRPENLRWLTRLENALLNPITVKRIEFICGSIEAFLEDPTILRQSKLDPNFQWMRTVSPQEAEICLKRMHTWAKADKPSSGGPLGEWIYTPSVIQDRPIRTTSDLVMAKTSGAAQRRWRTPSEFPCCPQAIDKDEPIATYASRLGVGALFARNDFSETVVLAVALAKDRQSLWVMCERRDGQETALKPWSVAQVSYEEDIYIHTSLGSFFTKEGAEKEFCLAQGLEWTGGDSFDDYC